MRRKTVVIVAAVIAVLFVLVTIMPAVMGLFSVSAKTTQELQSELSESQKERDKLKSELAKTKKEQQTLLEKKNDLDAQLGDYNDDISLIEKEIREKENNIRDKETEITVVSKEIDQSEMLLKKRLRVMYEQGSAVYLEVLFQSTGFSDMLTRVQLVQELLQHDKELISKLNEKKSEIADAKAKIETEQAEKETMRSMIADKKAAVQTKIAESNELTDQLKNKAEELDKAYEQEMKESKELENQIAQQKAAVAPPAKVYNSGGKLGYPLPAKAIVTSPYGMRFDPVYKKNKFHTGIDLNAKMGTPVLAAEDGVVIISTQQSAYGKYVVINHGSISTLYAHNSQLLVSVGQQVKRGERISLSGSTGNSTGPHLHFEVRDANNNHMDPTQFVNFY